MKHVFKTDEVAHIWAQQNQDDGRNAQGNLYFQGDTIFSYGSHFPIARFVAAGVVLITTKRYSNTISKHIGHVRDAISHCTVYYGLEVTSGGAHESNVRGFLKSFPLIQKKAVSAVKYGDYYKEQLSKAINETVRYVAYFKKDTTKELQADVRKWKKALDENKIFSEKELSKIKAVLSQKRKEATIKNAERRAIQAAKEAEYKQTQAENLEKWLNGENVYSSFHNLPSVKLRVKDDRVETTRGAQITVRTATRLWKALNAGVNVGGMTLDNYTVNGWDGVNLLVGCHTIPATELNRIAGLLGLQTGVIV